MFTDFMGYVTGEDEYFADVLPNRSDKIMWKHESWTVLEAIHVLKDSRAVAGLALAEVILRVKK